MSDSNVPVAPATEEFKDFSEKQLQETFADLRQECEKGSALLQDRSWTPEENELYGKKAALLTEAGLRLRAFETARTEQLEQMNRVSEFMQMELRSSEATKAAAPSASSAAINQLNEEAASAGLSDDARKALIQNLLGVPVAPDNTQQLSFRNGRYNEYTSFTEEEIVSEEKALSVETLNNPVYMDVFRNVLRRSQDSHHFMAGLAGRWNECCPDALATPSDFATGGFMVTPIQFASGLQRCCDRTVIMRQLANVVTVTEACRLGIRRLKERASSFAWSCECAPPKKCDVPTGQHKELEPHAWTQCTSVCNALLRKSTQNVEALLRDELARDLRENYEMAYLYGNGIQQPLGLFHKDGLDDECQIKLQKGSLNPTCLLQIACQLSSCVNASFLMGKKAYCDILSTTNGTGDYYWWNLIVQGGPGSSGNANRRPSLMGYPVYVSEFISDDFDTVGDYPLILGDFSSYMIADGPTIGLKRREDIFADTTCWVARGHTDGMSINDCNFKRAVVVS